MGISVILPSYKESKNLEIILPKIQSVLKDMNVKFEIIVVDTMEVDEDTKLICEKLKCSYVNRTNGNMYGDAIRTGIQCGNYKYIVIMDADGSHNPADIKRFYKEIPSYHMIIGSRYLDGGNSHNGPILKLMSYTVNVIYRIVFDLKLKDVSNSYRMYESKKLKSLELSCNNFDIVEEILIQLKVKYKYIKIKEVPIYFNKRLYGKSKRDLLKFMFSYITTITKLYKIKKREGKHYVHKKEI